MVLLALALPAAARAQAPATSYDRAFAAERRGSFAQAAAGYRQILADKPAELNALLGLERVLHELGKSAELAPAASAAVAADGTNPVLFGVAVRAWTSAGVKDSVVRMVERWAAIEPRDEAPYREWGFAALAERDRETAIQAYRLGRQRLGRSDALAGELAQLATWTGEYQTAIVEWLMAIHATPAHRASAVGMLSQVPLDRRAVVLGELDRRSDASADQLAAALAARWNQPLAGFERLLRRLPAGADGVEPLEQFLEELRTISGRDASLARARGMEALADRLPAKRTQWQAEAARAYAEAGEQSAARRMLSRLAGDPGAAPDAAATAGVTLVGVLIAEGKLEEAERRLRDLTRTAPVDEVHRLTVRLARAWLRAGQLDRGEALVEADSSIDGLAVRGRARLFRGDVAGATRALAAAGPFAADRADATERAAVLAILQVLEGDTVPALGRGFLALEQGDTARAAREFAEFGASLAPERGGAELLLLAGRLRLAGGAVGEAHALFQRAAGATGTAAAPAARLELARVLARQGRERDALAALEQLIIEYPQSAVAPQARRLLDTMRGGVPKG